MQEFPDIIESEKESVEDLVEVLISVDPVANYSTTEITYLLASLNSTLSDENLTATLQSNLKSLASVAFDPIFDFGVPGVLLNTVGVLGLFGNFISIVILSRPQMKSSINCILIGLASFDLILIITSILMFGIPSIYTYTVVTGHTPIFSWYYESLFPYIVGTLVYPVGLIAQTGSVYLTLCVTVERYVAICHPFKAKSLCTYGRARLYVLAVGLFSVAYNFPRFFEVSWQYTVSKEKNITEVAATNLRKDPLYIQVYINWMYMIFMYIIPFGLLGFFNFLIFNEVRRTNSLRAQLTRVQKKEIGLAMMLFCVVIIFFLCNSLALVVSILELTGKMLHPLTQTSNLLVTINSSVNFIIYCIFGEKFKRIFLQIFCRMISKNGSVNMELMRYPDNTMGQSLFNNETSPYNTVKSHLSRKKSAHSHNARTNQIHRNNTFNVNDKQISQVSINPQRSICKINNNLAVGNSLNEEIKCGATPISDQNPQQLGVDLPSTEAQRAIYPVSQNSPDITITVMVETCNHTDACHTSQKDNKYNKTKWTQVNSTPF